MLFYVLQNKKLFNLESFDTEMIDEKNYGLSNLTTLIWVKIICIILMLMVWLHCHNVKWVSTPLKKTTYLFLPSPPPPINLQTVQASTLSPPPVFSKSPAICWFFINYAKFLVKVSHFKFLVMTEKNISDFSLFFM